jgi:hypothetical protein
LVGVRGNRQVDERKVDGSCLETGLGVRWERLDCTDMEGFEFLGNRQTYYIRAFRYRVKIFMIKKTRSGLRLILEGLSTSYYITDNIILASG